MQNHAMFINDCLSTRNAGRIGHRATIQFVREELSCAFPQIWGFSRIRAHGRSRKAAVNGTHFTEAPCQAVRFEGWAIQNKSTLRKPTKNGAY